MANLRSQFPQIQTLVASSTVTTNTDSAALSIPYAQAYRFIVQVNTVTGTSPTLIVAIATSFDGGTTYNDIMATTTITTTGTGAQITFKSYLGGGDAAASNVTTLNSIATINPTAATVTNGPIDPRYVKIKYVVGGTSPSFSAVTVGVIATPTGDAVD